MLPYNNCGDVFWAINRKIWFLQWNHKIIWNIEVDTKGFFQELTLISKELSEGIDNSLFEAV